MRLFRTLCPGRMTSFELLDQGEVVLGESLVTAFHRLGHAEKACG
jgi:hypothetical protein